MSKFKRLKVDITSSIYPNSSATCTDSSCNDTTCRINKTACEASCEKSSSTDRNSAGCQDTYCTSLCTNGPSEHNDSFCDDKSCNEEGCTACADEDEGSASFVPWSLMNVTDTADDFGLKTCIPCVEVVEQPKLTLDTPSCLSIVASSSDLCDAMEALDMELHCTDESIVLIDKDDFFGFDGLGKYAWLYTIANDDSGSGWHCWAIDKDLNNCPVVYIGCEEERAKVAKSPKDFLQIALSLQPFFTDAIMCLPALRANEDLDSISSTGFSVNESQLKSLREQFEEDVDDVNETKFFADKILKEIQLERLDISKALELMFEAHLSHPRFAIT